MISVVINGAVKVYRDTDKAIDEYQKYVNLRLPVLLIDNEDVICPMYLNSIDFKKLRTLYDCLLTTFFYLLL